MGFSKRLKIFLVFSLALFSVVECHFVTVQKCCEGQKAFNATSMTCVDVPFGVSIIDKDPPEDFEITLGTEKPLPSEFDASGSFT
jgi:hypothetical protein